MCDTVAVLSDDGVLFGKNSDRDPNEAQAIEWHPGGQHPPGATVTCTYLTIPQTTQTYRIMISRPFWMWGAEMGANEHGVVIGNEAVFTRAPYAAVGLTGMDLVRLALERSATADGACETIVTLLETHGQGGGCGFERRAFTYHNGFLIADPQGAIVLETAGRAWATERVERVRSISNGLTIPGFRERHADRLRGFVAQSARRRAWVEQSARHARSALDIFATLRSHGDGDRAPAYSWLNGAMGGPCMHAGGMLAASQTTASWVADLAASTHWVTATAAPCTGLFKPLRVNDPLDLGTIPGASPDDSLWWRHERLHRTVTRNVEVLLGIYVDERDALEAAWVAAPPASAQAFELANALLSAWTDRCARIRVADTRPAYVRRYWRRRDRAAYGPGAVTHVGECVT